MPSSLLLMPPFSAQDFSERGLWGVSRPSNPELKTGSDSSHSSCFSSPAWAPSQPWRLLVLTSALCGQSLATLPTALASLPIPKVVRKAITTGLHLGLQGNASNPHPPQRVRRTLRPSWGLCAKSTVIIMPNVRTVQHEARASCSG